MLLDARERFFGDLGAGVDRRLERADPRRRIARRLDRIQEPDAVARKPEIGADRDRSRPACPLERPAHGARVPEVIAHQPLDALLRLRAGIPEDVGGLLLELVAEHVLVAARFEMQDRTHAQEEVLGVFESAGVGRAAPQQQRIGERRDGARRHHVAQRTGRLLHVGLELIQRRVELRVPLRDQLQQRPHDVGMRRRPVKHRPEPVEQLRGARDQTRIEQRQQELGVVGLEVGKLVQLPHLVADDDAEVPERVEKAAKEALLRRPDPATEQHQQVDVGMKTEVAPAVAAERDDGHWPLRRACVRIELPQQRVDAIRMAFERRAAARPARDVRAQLVPRRVESRPGCRARAGSRLRHRHGANISGFSWRGHNRDGDDSHHRRHPRLTATTGASVWRGTRPLRCRGRKTSPEGLLCALPTQSGRSTKRRSRGRSTR